MRVRTSVSIILIVLASFIGVASAQAATSLRGSAVDTSGGVLPGVTVTATPAATPQAEPQMQVTDGEGKFSFDDLAPGTYIVVVSLPGFEEKKFEALTVPASDELKVVLGIATLSETVTVRASIPVTIPREPIGESTLEEQVLVNIPLASDRFEEALPLLPGVVRGPDGLINMNGARADQSAVMVNGISMTDPVTNHFAVRLPLDAIESMNVHAGVYSAAFGNATGGVTDIVTKPGQDKAAFSIQNFMPRFRFVDGKLDGFNSFTPRVRVSGPIEKGRLWFSESASYRFVRTHVSELEPRDEAEQKITAFDSITQLDYNVSAVQHITGTFVIFPSNIDNAGLDTLHPYDATPDLEQRGYAGAIGHRAVIGSSSALSSSFAVKQFNMAVAPKRDAMAFITVDGARNNYFNQFDRDSRRYDASTTLATSVPSSMGQHLFRAGGQLTHTDYDGVDASQPVTIEGANGATLSRIDYLGSAAVGASNTEIAGFIEDQWAVTTNLTINGGVRYAYERIAGDQTLAPRVDASYRPVEGTVVKAGIGRFYDALPLNAADFDRQQSRLITNYDANGNATGSTLMVNRVASEGLQAPSSTAWNVELDQMIAKDLLARVGYRQTRGSNQLIVDPSIGTSTLTLSSHGNSRSDEIEATLRRKFANGGHITASYVHAKTEGDLNDFVSIFGDLRDPVILSNEYSRQAFDTPNRFLVWGVINLPREIALSPTFEWRNGFPYTVIDQTQQAIGVRNDGDNRFPNFWSMDLAATKDVRIMKHRARVGIQVFNLTDHFNPQDLQNNTSSAQYGEFANSVKRQVRAKFVLLF